MEERGTYIEPLEKASWIDMKKDDLFIITYQQLPLGEIALPFNLYTCNNIDQSFTLFHQANIPLGNSKRDQLAKITEQGSSLAIKKSQQKTFKKTTSMPLPASKLELEKKEVEETKEEMAAPPPKKEEMAEEKTTEIKEDISPYAEDLPQAEDLPRDIMAEYLQETLIVVSNFALNISPTVSLARKLCSLSLSDNNYHGQTTILSYAIAKANGIGDVNELSDLIVASLVHKIGLTQIPIELTSTNLQEMNNFEFSAYKGHMALSQNFLRKYNIELSPRCLRIIVQYQERYNGKGYPFAKTQNSLEDLALILGLAAHIVDFSQGLVNGHLTPIEQTLTKIQNDEKDNGLDLNFSNELKASLQNIIGRSDEKEVA